MLNIQGAHNTAKIFTDNVEPKALAQIQNLLDQEFAAGSQIRIMPDVHAGAGCTIGTTMTITDKVVPNLVGVDIGCAVHVEMINNKHIDLQLLDEVIHEKIPSGRNVRDEPHPFNGYMNLGKLICKNHIDHDRAYHSIGTLGDGNHFIEIDIDDDGNLYLVVHTGSRYLGKQVAEYYQNRAFQNLNDNSEEIKKLIFKLKCQGRETEIESEIKKINTVKIDKNLAYLEDELFLAYLHDIKIVQDFAEWNRSAIVSEIIRSMNLCTSDGFTTMHNYIDTDGMILRKGAISAKQGEHVLIPINMRDGSLICVGKGNPDWNYSAPHGAGRLMSRTAAKANITLEQHQQAMSGIYSSTVNDSTIDESPSAYKPMDEIIRNIGDTVDVVKIIKPIYNFKSGE